ncbi:MAG: cob(I)yrinic acid a,c-diamide adenosyltransferase [Alphaproteobacteria bacterium]|nr:MAG: cob(I)yrinic acid a,c-diamide adenosyltransferase [Alphaproteobacteria bacterium]
MVRLTRIYTRGGDMGETSLAGGSRVSKDSLRLEAIGAVDEANAAIGVARLHVAADLDSLLARIQNELFDLGADLATPLADNESQSEALRIQDDQVARLEREIDTFNSHLPPLSSFVLPGGTPAAAHLHQARTIVRRAERRLVAAMAEAPFNPVALAYLNRLSDHLFVLARHANGRGEADVLWRPGATREGGA